MRFLFLCLFTFVIYFTTLFNSVCLEEKHDFLAVVVASNETDGFKRFLRSAKYFDIPLKVLGMGQKWEGGDMKSTGGGQKVILLKEVLEHYKDDTEKIIMFSDSYDVVIAGKVEDIVFRFKQMDAGIVFSAESNCWPDRTLADDYPVTESKYKYLNSGGFIGYAADIYKFISSSKEPLKTNSDDQLFYTKLFLDPKLREEYHVKLDYKSTIFQNLFSAAEDVELRFDDAFSYLENTKYSTVPLVIHGNGVSKTYFNSLTNYIPNTWTRNQGCVTCYENVLRLPEKEDDYPEVLVGVFITQPTPFLEEFFTRFEALQYPKKKLHLFLYNSVAYHEDAVKKFVEAHSIEYKSFKQIQPSDEINEADGRTLAIKQCEKKKSAYYLNVDSIAQLDNPKTLQLLIEGNRGILAPLLLRPFKAWSNFWGALSHDGYYQRSFDYMNIVNYEQRGIWNVPYITSVYLINATVIKNVKPNYHHDINDPDMAFCSHYRNEGVFMYVDNRIDYGHLVDPDQFDISRVNPDFYQLLYNRYEWEQRYLHPNYSENLNPNKTVLQPCPDVYWFPIVTPRFCKELIEIMESFGKWSDGSNKDERLDGGYENVPTRDIHMKQVGLDRTWLEFLDLYVQPIQAHLFIGYEHDPPRSLMNFVIRYKPDEQPLLKPHHDSSTYTINLALNKPNIDYKGGGCKFIRYNCSVVDTKVGWLLMHPGRLTHYHEGLEVTEGIRYIAISFVDP